MHQKQTILAITMEDKQRAYESHIKSWEQQSRAQLELSYADKREMVLLQRKKEKATLEIETILNKQSQFFKNLTSILRV